MEPVPLSACTFAPMYLRHVPAVGAIERRNYEFSWSEGIFRDCLKAGYTCQLILIDEQMAGYGIMQSASDEAHILNLCIDYPYQRQGLARRLLEHLIALAAGRRARIVFLEVRPSNQRAVTLYHLAGFNEIGVRKDYYHARSGREDALVMARSLETDGQSPAAD